MAQARKKPGCTWPDFLEHATPGHWNLVVHSLKLPDGAAPVRTTIELPVSKDIAAELGARGHAPGVYKLMPVWNKARGQVFADERARLGMPTRSKAPTGVVEVTVDHVLAPTARDPKSVESRETAALRHEALQAEARAKIARAKAEEAKSLAAARSAERAEGADASALASLLRDIMQQQQQPKPAAEGGAGMLALVQLMQQQAQTHQTMLLEMLKTTREESRDREEQLLRIFEHARPPQPGENMPGLGALKEHLELFRAIKEMIAPEIRDTEPEPWWQELAKNVGGTVVEAVMAQKFGGQKPPAPPPAATVPAAPLPAPPPAPAANGSLAAERVAHFVGSVITEWQSESHPAAAADKLGEDIGLLPTAVRQQLDAGNWRLALEAMAQHLSAEQQTMLAAAIEAGGEAAAQWLDEFGAACATEDEDEQEPVPNRII